MGNSKLISKLIIDAIVIRAGAKASGDGDDHDHGDTGDDIAEQSGTKTLTRPASETKTPSFYKVVILNDDFTPREYVIHVLKKFFHKSDDEAAQLMLQVHHKGAGVAGVFTFEIAETKAFQVNEYSKQHKYPLKCSVEKA